MESIKGQLLIASPSLVDPNFRRTVVLIAEHTEEGAMGVVLNRPSDTAVGEAAPQLGPLVGDEETVYVGGPVSPGGIVVLAEFQDPDDAALIVLDDVGFPSAEADFGELADGRATSPRLRRPRRLGTRPARSGAGGGGVDPRAAPPRGALLRRTPRASGAPCWAGKGGRYALLGRMPPDPSMN